MGDNILAYFSETDNTVYVEGFGEMYDFDRSPFTNNASNIHYIRLNNKDGFITTIGTYAFDDANVVEITGTDYITSIGNVSFRSTLALDNFNFPAIEHIGDFAFSYSESLCNGNNNYTIFFPASLNYLGECAFITGSPTTKYYVFNNHSTIPQITVYNPFESNGVSVVVVPDNLYEDWCNEQNWASILNDINSNINIMKYSDFVAL